MNTFRSLYPRLLLLALTGAGTLATTEVRAETHVNVGVSVGAPLPHGYARVAVGSSHYYYNRGTFYRPGPHGGYYVVRAPRGAVVRTLPPYYRRVYWGGSPYYYYSGVYYQSSPGGYVVVEPPPSTVIVTQSPNPQAVGAGPTTEIGKDEDYQTVWAGDVAYQFKDGQFFKKTADGLMWVEAPLGALTKTLPSDAKSVWYQDIEYFECDDVYFRKTADGYKVVTAPWKA
jgi:hypothetical protein